MTIVLGALLGIGLGLLSALPGVHVSVLLVGLLPLLGLDPLAAAAALVGTVGSGMTATTLAKTFHPATKQTIQAATPEQRMAYNGHGKKAVRIQLFAIWSGAGAVLLCALPLLGIFTWFPRDAQALVDSIKPLGLLFIIGFLVTTWYQARNKALTALVMVAGGLVGFYVLNHPALVGNASSLAPLLSGVFALPALLMILFHSGHIRPFPRQRADQGDHNHLSQVWGALGGILTAMTAGLGSGSAVSLFAESVTEEEYLGMHTASESANNLFAILLLIVAGASHSGVGVALKQQLPQIDVTLGIILLFIIFLGLQAGTQLITWCTDFYVKLVTRVPQKLLALFVLLLSLGLVLGETGSVGLLAALAAGCLGLAARLYCLPNQALSTVLVGPVLIYYVGMAGPLAHLMGITR